MKRKIRIKQSVQQAVEQVVVGVDPAQGEDTTVVFTSARTGERITFETPSVSQSGFEAPTAGQGMARGGRVPNIPRVNDWSVNDLHVAPMETVIPVRPSATEMLARMGASADEAANSFQALSAAIHRPRHSFAMDITIERAYRTLETLVYLQVRISGDDPSSFSAVARIPDERLNRNSSSFLNEETVYRLHDAARDLARYIGFWGIREAMLTYRPSGVTAEIARCVLDLANRELRG